MSGSQDEIPPPPPPPPSSSQTPTQQTPHTVSTIKLPILKKGEYDIWAMKMEHYLAHTDYPIWEVIQNGNGPVSITTDTQGQIKVLPPRTAEEIVARERERKARTTLLMALPEDHLAKFHKMTDAKEMWDAIKSRFGGNDESKKMQKYILKQQFEGFSVSNTEGLHKGYDRFQSLLSQLEIHGAGVSTEDANQKFLRSLPSAWSQVSLIMRTKPGVDSLSFDDLYNNLRVFESDVKGSTASSSSPQNVAFVSENTSSTNEHKVLFTETECLVATPDFKMPDENQILLKVPRQHNMYSFDMKTPGPAKSFTCLIAKATFDESKLWHRRLGHINFKHLNKLVKGNLVRGLPSKVFRNDHTCVACQKDLVRVKIIRSDNGIEFKNKDMLEFCGNKGIKQEYSNVRTPQQNGVAERMNRTLIEAARTMLADSLLPTTF
ncbi:ribonuclease H-like domain-containing protein [Tanacetum coccineum]